MNDEPQILVVRTNDNTGRNSAKTWQFWTALTILVVAIVFAFMHWGGAAFLLVLLAGVILADGILR